MMETLNTLIGFGTLGMQLLAGALLVAYLLKEERVTVFVARVALPFSFLAASVSVVMTLIYSEYFGIVPCGLCWLQRVALYPQVLLFAIAWKVHDRTVALYSIALSVFGMVVALYQHYLQMGGGSVLPCPASGEADCAKRIMFEMGYITYPLSAFSLFALLTVVMLIYWRHRD